MKTNRWKMAILAWTAMFSFSTLLPYSFSQVSFTASCADFAANVHFATVRDFPSISVSEPVF
ncbi:hypothetical protein [Spirosoma endbachense]|uniref:Uncharacterized protein n=1 Tax=Spirosoma endbachense TaxID=2666025 RepID=A0A6P1VXQ7_9BACT|nr:hypothetical protein [Spirosoma endbachense]QHV97981.1 hypothetical protein GJR95_24525 [Spirosoma endbachense]